MEPQYMILGEAAGVAASIAVRDRIGVTKISIKELQSSLRSQKVILSN
jgi:hypothetical protein